jgi:opacity protein-like surface antigen
VRNFDFKNLIQNTGNLMLCMGFLAFSSSVSAVEKKPSTMVKEAVAEVAPSTPLTNKIHKHQIGIGIGETFLFGKFDDSGSDKITLDFFYDYAASYSFDLLVNLHISNHTFKGEEVDLASLNMNIKSKLFNFDQFSPYAAGGLGFYYPTMTRRDSDGKLQDSDGQFVFGWQVGGGVELDLNEKYNVGIMLMYFSPFKVKQDEQAAVDGSYMKLLITSMYAF